MRTIVVTYTLAAAALLVAGCEDKPKMMSAAEVADAGEKAVDPALAKAVAAASAKDAKGAAPAGSGDEPPETGVFAPGAADRAMPKGAPAKLVLGGEGSEPRVALSSMQPAAGYKHPGELVLTLQTGGGALPPMALALRFEAKKPKAPAAEGEAIGVTATVTRAGVSDAGGNLPKEVRDQLGKLQGSSVEYSVARNGAGGDFRVVLAKAADPGLGTILSSLAEGLATLTIPFPDKPVGAGAFWMVTTREELAGIDVVAYRLVKVESIAGDVLTLSESTKRYAASDTIDVPGLPPDMKDLKLAQFDASSLGTIQVRKGTPIPITASLTQTLLAPLSSGAQQAQGQPQAGLRAQTKLEFTLGEAGKPAK